jgi:hypothetical protein
MASLFPLNVFTGGINQLLKHGEVIGQLHALAVLSTKMYRKKFFTPGNEKQ